MQFFHHNYIILPNACHFILTTLKYVLQTDEGILAKLASDQKQAKLPIDSVTRLGNFLHFGQQFKVGGKNYFTQIAHIVSKFL